MHLILQRRPTEGGHTIGTLTADGRQLCFTLEDAIRERPGQPVATWKVHGQTAIPAGTYRVTLENSPRFGPRTLTVHDVPGFTGVRMHAGNTERDTEGCPLLGAQVDASGIVGGTSRPAVDLVRRVVQMATDAGERVTLEVRNP